MIKSTPNNKLRVGFVLDDGLDKPDGVQQYILTLGEWLKSKGHYVRYLVGETSREDIKEAIPLARNLKVRFNGNSLSTPFPASTEKIKATLKQEKFDILHVQVPYSPFMAGKVIRYADEHTKIIGTFHVLPVGRLQYTGSKLLGYAMNRSLKHFDKFLSVSPPAQKFAEETFGIKSEVLPNPVSIEKYHKTTAKDDYLNIVFIGRLVPRKGCMNLLKAVNGLVKLDGSLSLRVHICGTGNQQSKLENYIRSTGLGDVVKMHGFVSEEKKIDFLSKADLSVFPSISGESFGIVLIEAMAAGGGVVLAGNNPGYSSVLSGAPESLFNPNDPDELRDKLHKLIKDKEQYEKIYRSQQKLIRQFDIPSVGQKLLDVYAEVLR